MYEENVLVLILKRRKHFFFLSNNMFDGRKWVSVKALTECAMFDFIQLSTVLLLMMTPALHIV
jgi:hypothetical protein